MNINEFKDPEWDGDFEIIGIFKEIDIVLLKFVNRLNFRSDGRCNLFGIKSGGEIFWEAQLPSFGYQAGLFNNLKLEGDILIGWYGGSILLTINPNNGKIINEQFIK